MSRSRFNSIFFILVFILIIKSGFSQVLQITYSAKDLPLGVVLEEISKANDLKFAYDADVFGEINSSFELISVNLDDFFDILLNSYSIKAKKIGETYVFTIDKSQPVAKIIIPPEKYIISGFISDIKTGEKLMYCNVAASGNKGSMTNELGFFTFELEQVDSINILVSYLGYQQFDTTVVLPLAKPLDISLVPFAILMKEIRVELREKNFLDAASQPEKVGFNPSQTINVPRIAENDMINALSLIPGVNFVSGSSGGLSIRGSAPSDNLMILDGIPVLESSHMFGNMSVLNAKYIQQAFVSRGGFDASYGGRVSGLVELKGKSGRLGNPYLDVSGNLLNTNVLANIPLTDKFSVTAAWRRSFIDTWPNYLFKSLSEANSGQLDEESVSVFPVVNYQDLNVKTSFHPNKRQEINLNFLLGTDNMEKEFELGDNRFLYRNEFSSGKNYGMSLNWSLQSGENWFHTFSAGYSNLDNNFVDESGKFHPLDDDTGSDSDNSNNGKGKGKDKNNNGKGTDKDKSKYELDNGENAIEEIRAAWKSEFKTGILRNQIGAGLTSDSFSYRFIADRSTGNTPVDSINNSSEKNIAHVFVQQFIDLNKKLTIRWGVRGNVDVDLKKTYWEPRLGLVFNPSDEISFHMTGGRYYQYLSRIKRINQENSYDRVWFLPDSTGIGMLDSYHYILGGRYEKKGFLITVEGYRKNINGRGNLKAELYKKGNESRIEYVLNQGTEQSHGVDIFIQLRNRRWNHMLGYSLSESEEKISESQADFFPSVNDRRHRLTITEMFKYKNWAVTGNWQFNSGLPIFDISSETPVYTGERFGNFSQVDISITKKIVTNHFNAHAGVSFLNVFNRKNILEVDYLRFASTDGVTSVRSEINSFAFTPVFFINFKIH